MKIEVQNLENDLELPDIEIKVEHDEETTQDLLEDLNYGIGGG